MESIPSSSRNGLHTTYHMRLGIILHQEEPTAPVEDLTPNSSQGAVVYPVKLCVCALTPYVHVLV